MSWQPAEKSNKIHIPRLSIRIPPKPPHVFLGKVFFWGEFFNLIFSNPTMPRKRLTIGEKLAILKDANDRLSRGESMRSIARIHGLQANQIVD